MSRPLRKTVQYKGQKYAFHCIEYMALPGGLGVRRKKHYAKMRTMEGRWVRIPLESMSEQLQAELKQESAE